MKITKEKRLKELENELYGIYSNRLSNLERSLKFKLYNKLKEEKRNENTKRKKKVVIDRKSTRLNSSHIPLSRMPSSA